MVPRSQQLSLYSAFAAHGVEYVVVGGMAVLVYGYHRMTRDVDVFIRPTPENARATFAALLDLNAPLEGIHFTDLLNDEVNFRFKNDFGAFDILASIGDMSFDQAWRNRLELFEDGIPIPVISRDDLIENKLQVGRLRDLADVEELQLVDPSEVPVSFFPNESDAKR